MEASTVITGIISPAIALVPTLMLVWKSWEKKQVSLAVRLIRQKGRIEKMRLRHRAELEQELLKLDILEREAKHKAELKNFEVGLEREEEKEILAKTNPLTNLKQKGENLVKGKVGQVKETISDKVNSLLETKGKKSFNKDDYKERDKK